MDEQRSADAEDMSQDLANGNLDGAIHDWEGAPATDGDESAARDASLLDANDDAPDDVEFDEDVAATIE